MHEAKHIWQLFARDLGIYNYGPLNCEHDDVLCTMCYAQYAATCSLNCGG